MKQLLAATFLALLPNLALSDIIPEPQDYRMDHYRAPVPATIAGGTVLDPQAANDIWLSGNAAFIDVMPQAPKPENLPEGTIWRDKPRDTIPGAIWLPNVGYGAIADVTADYFRKGLEQVTGGEMSHPIVMFCLEDCWMSWNAAKRAIEWGYTDVYWMPEGTDGWAFWSYPLERIKPMEPQP
ncbi:PQQ-dependent catabolism-associated CXXCW motif protein [Roseovarius aestuariivivens]|uniref:PQQ-dependent catabolism-associated CXXCW motif protein n=1 Tax=Roseovarius aestuariivivens TaxID=1888910 RepID=UPI001080E516|nr:PQQ-dependent catabolism-associated CXXCW motif protein [Roseovarius aestuariivivens]